MNDPTPEELAEFHEAQEFAQLTPHQRDTAIRIVEQRERQEEWADQNRDWIGDHMELFDGDDDD